MNEPQQHLERRPQSTGLDPHKRPAIRPFFSGFRRGKPDLRNACPAPVLPTGAVELIRINVKPNCYPPDLQDAAVQLVLQQAELLSAEWAVA